MDQSAQHDAGDSTRGFLDHQTFHGLSEPRRTSHGYPLTKSRSQQPAWPRFSVPTSADSLSSGFPYDKRIRQLGVSNEEWHQFTSEVVNEAKLSLEDDKVAWGAGIATGTASSAFLLVLGPVAGYYTGKAVHKRTVVEKVRERLQEDGQISKVLRNWNEGPWARRGFHTWIEFPDEGGVGVKKSDVKRFRIVVIPNDGIAPPPKLPISPPAVAEVNTPAPVERPAQPTESQPSISQIGSEPEHPGRHSSVPQIYPLAAPVKQASQEHIQSTQIPVPEKIEYPPPPTEPPLRHSSIPQIQPIPVPVHQTTQQQDQAVQIPVPEIFEPSLPPPPPPPPKMSIDPPKHQTPDTQIHEMPGSEAPTFVELPDNEVHISELPSEPVYRYEMDGGSVPVNRR